MNAAIRTTLVFILLSLSSLVAQADEYDDAISSFKSAGESGYYFDNSVGYAVFPTIGKGGIGIGGAHGNGIVYRGGAPVGKSELKQVTIGLQLGGQKFIEVIFFKDKTAFDDFTRENFEFGAQASAVAFSHSASADLAYNGGVAIVTMAEGGLMYEATVGGQKFEYEAY